MASQDHNGVKFVHATALYPSLGENPIAYEQCMSLEATLNDKKKLYSNKVQKLIEVLASVLIDQLSKTSPQQTLLLFEFFHRHTLNLALHGDWGKYTGAKTHLCVNFKRFEATANKKNLPAVVNKIRSLLKILSDPWGNPTITKILNGEDCTDEEVLILLREEMGLVLVVRLEIMAEARCDAQALRLIEASLRCTSDPRHAAFFEPFAAEVTYTQDIYLILLVRAKTDKKKQLNEVLLLRSLTQQAILSLWEAGSCREGAKLDYWSHVICEYLRAVTGMDVSAALSVVRRYKAGNGPVRLRKSYTKMVDMVTNMAVAHSMIRPVPMRHEVALCELAAEWCSLHGADTQLLIRRVKNMILHAVSSHHIYIFSQILAEKFGETEKSQCIELFIRALTVNLNEVQKFKSINDAEKVKEYEVRLSNGFLLLANYLHEDVLTSRECVLTAFSLNPTLTCYERLKALAIRSGKLHIQVGGGRDDDCENNQSSINCERRMSENQSQGTKLDTGQLDGAEPTSQNQKRVDDDHVTDATPERDKPAQALAQTRPEVVSPIHITQNVGIPQTLCDDLSTVLSSARYQMLSWHLDWVELSARCEAYIVSEKQVRSSEIELKYLNIDYDQFKDWPQNDEFDTGIEKGFEGYVESDSDEGIGTSHGTFGSKLSHDEDTQDSVDYCVKSHKSKYTHSSSSDREMDKIKTVRRNKKTKRNALSSISDSENLSQESIQFDEMYGNSLLMKGVPAKSKKTKVIGPRTKKPSSCGLLPDEHCEMLDIASIEQDATCASPVLIGNVNCTPPKTTGNTMGKPTYCIINNDLASPFKDFNSPSKLSDPSVLKSLRTYRKKCATDEINFVPERNQTKDLIMFNPREQLLNGIADLHPRIISRPKAVMKSLLENGVAPVNGNHEADVIELIDDDEEDIDNDAFEHKIPGKYRKITLPYDITSKMKLNFESDSKIPESKSAFHTINRKNNIALGLNSLDMLRPAPSETTVQVVQLAASSRTSNSNSAPLTTVIFTMPNQTSTVTTGNSITNPSVINSMTTQLTSITQVSNSDLSSFSTIINTIPQQALGPTQMRSGAMTVSVDSKSLGAAGPSFGHRSQASVAGPRVNVSGVASTSIATTGRTTFHAATRHIYPQSPGVGYLARPNSEQSIPNQITPSSSAHRTANSQDLIMTETSNLPYGVIRVERISLVTTQESNQPLPNLSPIKTQGNSRSQVGLNRQQMYMRSNVARTNTITSTQGHTVVTSSRHQAAPSTSTSTSTSTIVSSGRSMPVTPHIQRVGYPRDTSPTQNAPEVQMKYLFKDGVLSETDDKAGYEGNDADSRNVSMVLNVEEMQQLVSKKTAQKDKSSDHDENSSLQGSSLPKFQQAFGRTLYQSGPVVSGNPTAVNPSNESSQLTFVQPIQSSSANTETVTSATICTVLSKAVQTANKGTDMTNKTPTQTKLNDHSNHHKIPMQSSTSTSTSTVQTVAVSTSTSTSTSPETQPTPNFTSTKNRPNDRSAPLPQTPVKFICKVPMTINSTNLKSVAFLKTAGAPDKLSQTQIDNRGKETVIRSSNMSAFLALPAFRQVPSSSTTSGTTQTLQLKLSTETEKKKPDQIQSSSKVPHSKNYRKIPIIQNQPVARYSKPILQISASGSGQNSAQSTPVVTIPIRTVLSSGQQTSLPVPVERADAHSEPLASPSPPEDSSGSSTLDQQLKEFESVFNKVKKSSQMKEMTNNTTIQPHLGLTQQILLTQPSSSANVEFTSTNQTALFQSTSTSTIHDLQGERVSLTYINQPVSGATDTLISGSNQKVASATPVVVVPVTSPALSVTSQSSNSPAAPSTPGSLSGKIATTAIVKQNKANKSKTASKAAPTTTLKVSTLPKPQQKPQEDEQTTQRIYAILDKYAEQLRNSPELKNKPAPRRRSNPPTNPSQNSKRKKSTQTKSKLPSHQASCSSSGMEMSPGSEDLRTMGSEDSSNGVSQLSQTVNSPLSRQDDPSTPTGGDLSSETSESLDARDTRVQPRLVLSESSGGQGRTVIVPENAQVLNVDASKLLKQSVVVSNQTLVPLSALVPGNVSVGVGVGGSPRMLMPVSVPDNRAIVVGKNVPGAKMYRVHKVTVSSAHSGPILGTNTVVLRQMCATPSPTGSSLKLPLCSAPVSGHSFASDEAINIGLNSTAILLNPTTSQAQLSFVRNIPCAPYQSQDGSTVTTMTTVISAPQVQKPAVAYSAPSSNVGYVKQDTSPDALAPSLSVSQDCLPAMSRTATTMTCIALGEEMEFTSSENRADVTTVSDVPTLVISQSGTDDERWRSTDTSGKKEDRLEEFPMYQSPVKSVIGHRTSSASDLLSKQDQFADNKNIPEKDSIADNDHETGVKEEKPEIVQKEAGICEEESASSDSAGSGRVKTRSGEKPHLMPESVQNSTSSWPYSVTKIECIVKSESPTTSVKREDADSHALALVHSQGTIYKKKGNNVENTIYQMAFKRSDRNKMPLRELDRGAAAALERDLRLQKSLSEECEDLGVDEPSTSDLFPEAELLLDPDHSSHDSQLDLPNEPFVQALNSSSSSDSRATSPVTLCLGKRPTATYKNTQRCQTVAGRSRFHSMYNPVYHLEESTRATMSSPESPGVYGTRSAKLSSASDGGGLSTKGNDAKAAAAACGPLKSSSSGTSTPINGGETASTDHDETRNSCTSEEARCAKKNSDKDTELETTTDSDSNVESLDLACRDASRKSESTFVPIPNPAVKAPYTYSGTRGTLKMATKKVRVKQEIWKNIIKGCDTKEDPDSDTSDQDRGKTVDKRSTSTDDDLPSEGETQAKNGLGTESEETQSVSDKGEGERSLKKSRKRTGSVLRCSPSKAKSSRRSETDSASELVGVCMNSAGRRSSLRGHIKKNCPCCNGSKDRQAGKAPPQKAHATVNANTNASCPSSSSPVLGTSKKKTTSKNFVKSSHITKKR